MPSFHHAKRPNDVVINGNGEDLIRQLICKAFKKLWTMILYYHILRHHHHHHHHYYYYYYYYYYYLATYLVTILQCHPPDGPLMPHKWLIDDTRDGDPFVCHTNLIDKRYMREMR